MRGATCFSGIGAPEAAMPWIDWRWAAEVEAFPAAVHGRHLPGIPNLGDVLDDRFLARAVALGPIDILVGGPPCQDFSVAGLRAGLGGARGNLSMRWLEIIDAVDPLWAVTENVRGWLSDANNAFGHFLAGLVGEHSPLVPTGGRWTDAGMVDGPGRRAAWRILDAQYFGVPQRRRRVFVVASPRDGGDPAAVLLERASLRGDPPPCREAGERVAAGLTHGVDSGGKGGYAGRRREDDINLVASAVTASDGHHGRRSPRGDGSDNLIAGTVRSHPRPGSNSFGMIAPPITSNPYGDHESREGLLVAFGGNNQAGPIDVATACNAHGGPHGRLDFESETFVAHAFDARQSEALRARKPGQSEASTGTVIGGSAVRRLTPRECEKLQGFPADWTLVPYRGKPAADGPRYRAIGNSMAVPVVAWIGQRIRAVMEAMSGRRWVS